MCARQEHIPCDLPVSEHLRIRSRPQACGVKDDVKAARAELAAMEDDPSLFLSSAGDASELGAADYLELPSTSVEPVEASAETPAAVPPPTRS